MSICQCFSESGAKGSFNLPKASCKGSSTGRPIPTPRCRPVSDFPGATAVRKGTGTRAVSGAPPTAQASPTSTQGTHNHLMTITPSQQERRSTLANIAAHTGENTKTHAIPAPLPWPLPAPLSDRPTRAAAKPHSVTRHEHHTYTTFPATKEARLHAHECLVRERRAWSSAVTVSPTCTCARRVASAPNPSTPRNLHA